MQGEEAVEQAVSGVPASDRVLHSDPHDFAGLYIRHRASFTLHARRYLRDARDADEVVQEAFLRLFLALPELETELQALAYCRRTITNLCIDRFRAQARRPALIDLDSAGAMDLAEDDPGDPVVRAEDAAMVRAALSLLSPLHRAALVKREIEEKTLPVIAEELEIPEESVKHVLFRARRALRRILAGTSLVPGSDAEIAGALGKAARAGSGGLAVFLLLLVLGLGTGPDLRAIPVVGSDLPDLIPVTEIAAAVGDAVVVVADGVTEAVSKSGGGNGTPAGSDDPAPQGEPLVAVAPSPSASPTATLLPPVTAAPSSTGKPTPTTKPAPTPTPAPVPTPSGTPTPGSGGEPAPAGTEEPGAVPTPSGTAQPSPKVSPSPKSSPSASPSSSAEPAKKSPSTGVRSNPAASPSSAPTNDPSAYQTEGLEYTEDPETGQLVLVPLGQSAATWRS